MKKSKDFGSDIRKEEDKAVVCALVFVSSRFGVDLMNSM
jgi:hypothetical protein